MTLQKTVLVTGAGGFIGSHMVTRLKSEGYWVRGVDLKFPEFSQTDADDFVIQDLRNREAWNYLLIPEGNGQFDEIYQFAADMGGAGFVFTGEHDADIMHNSATINLNVLDALVERNKHFNNFTKTLIFYSSSACIYPEHNQLDPISPNCKEDSAYPANPDSMYGWEKLFSEQLYQSYAKNYKIPVRIARYHNIFGPKGTWTGGREKSPAALCRKIAETKINHNTTVDIWGDGHQTRSFLYIDECIEATRRLVQSKFQGPVNIGSDEMVSINQLVKIISKLAKIKVKTNHIDGPLGVRGRNSDNTLIAEKLKWSPSQKLVDGLEPTYAWINEQVKIKAKGVVKK